MAKALVRRNRHLSAVVLLEDVVAPERAMRSQRERTIFAPFFRDLAEASRALAYEASRSRAHRPWLSLHCGDWEQAEDAVLAIPDATGIADALRFWPVLLA